MYISSKLQNMYEFDVDHLFLLLDYSKNIETYLCYLKFVYILESNSITFYNACQIIFFFLSNLNSCKFKIVVKIFIILIFMYYANHQFLLL